MKFAPSTGCFYPDDITYPDGTIPADAIDATPAEFALWCAAEWGSTIAVVDGKLTITPPPAPALDQVKSTRIAQLSALYQNAAAAPLEFTTAAGTKAQFSRDASAKTMIDLAVSLGAASWTASVWIDAAHAPVSPFTFADIQGLQTALAAPTSPSLSDLMSKVALVNAATDIAAVADVSF